MPPIQYTLIHPSAGLSTTEKSQLAHALTRLLHRTRHRSAAAAESPGRERCRGVRALVAPIRAAPVYEAQAWAGGCRTTRG